MINADFKLYNFFTIGEKDAYGQPVIPTKDTTPDGQIKIAIYTTSQSTQNNINYKDCSYIGLTQAEVKDTYIIEFGKELLKVLYSNPSGRFTQVFLKNI